MCLACSPARGSGSCGSRGGANLEARVRGLVRPREEELELAYRALDDERASGLARRAVEVVERRDAERERAVGLLARLSCFVPGALTSLHGRLLDADVPSSFSPASRCGESAPRAVFFVAGNDRGFVTVYRGLPYDGPLGIRLYERFYTSGVPTVDLPGDRRKAILDHRLRSRTDAADLVRQLELGRVAK